MRKNLRFADCKASLDSDLLMEQLLKDAFDSDTVGDLPGYPSNNDFLRDFHRRIAQLSSGPTFEQVWFSGILRGMAAFAFGIVLFVGLNTLPPIFINASITGSGLLKEKLVSISAGQHVLVQRLITHIQSQNPDLGRN